MLERGRTWCTSSNPASIRAIRRGSSNIPRIYNRSNRALDLVAFHISNMCNQSTCVFQLCTSGSFIAFLALRYSSPPIPSLHAHNLGSCAGKYKAERRYSTNAPRCPGFNYVDSRQAYHATPMRLIVERTRRRKPGLVPSARWRDAGIKPGVR